MRIIKLGLIIFILSELCEVNQASLSLNEEKFNNQHKAARWKKRYKRSLDDLDENDLKNDRNYSSICTSSFDSKTNQTSPVDQSLADIILSLQSELYKGPVCGEMYVRGDEHDTIDVMAEDLKNCAIVDGSISMLFINNAISNDNKSHVEETMLNYRFPQLREITEYLLIYRVYHLATLRWMFPNLVRIGGKKLFNERYSLVIFENSQMREIGLQSLKYIEKGSVRIENNGLLCYLDTIDWSMLGKDGDGKISNSDLDSDTFMVVKNNKESGCLDICGDTCGVKGCWGHELCQLGPCPAECTHACDKRGQCMSCHSECLGGCYKPNNNSACFACKTYLSEGTCVDKCPPHLYLKDGWHCATKHECKLNSKFVLHDGNCSTSCPPGYKQKKMAGDLKGFDRNLRECVKCNGSCNQVCCDPEHTINSLESLKKFNHLQCTIVVGKVEITGLTKIADVKQFYKLLKETFEIVEEVGGLVVSKSYLLSSLHFFSSLKRITGAAKHEGKYSLYVLDNRNLKDLWSTDVVIESGKSFFYYNPMLCKEIIDKVIALTPGIEEKLDHSLNGEKAAYPCLDSWN